MPPSPILFINSLLSQLSSSPNLSTPSKPLLLTLHCLFPNEFLLALDILDRGLARRMRSKSQTNPSPGDQDQDEDEKVHPQDSKEEIFYVTSASASTSTNPSEREREQGYEVRLHAWNCTCAAFAMSAFREHPSEPDSTEESTSSDEDDAHLQVQGYGYSFGGTLTRPSKSPPVCKHLLACILMARYPGLGGDGEGVRLVGVEELAGLCAGWGG